MKKVKINGKEIKIGSGVKLKDLEKVAFLVDESVLRPMFEGKSGKSKAKEVMMMMKEIKDKGRDLTVKTPMSHFLRALWTADPNTTLKNVQKTMSFLDIIPSFADFKSEKSCMDEMLMIAKVMGGKK